MNLSTNHINNASCDAILLKANIVHRNLNPCGGGERLSITIMQAIYDMGIDFDITTFEKPDMLRLENSYGKNVASSVERAKKINILSSALSEELEQQNTKDDTRRRYDITINTHGDALPYYRHFFSKNNAITHCHLPTAKYHIESENEVYLKETKVNTTIDNAETNNDYNTTEVQASKKRCFRMLNEAYMNLMKNTLVLTNSEFSKRAILDSLGIEALVLSPPVDTDTFRNAALSSGKREDIILVLSRIVPYKKIENAIRLAKILKKNSIGKEMKIVGNLYDDDFVIGNYYSNLMQMIKDLDLADYITFELNTSFDELLTIMRQSKIYLHTAAGESFGMSTVEAMSAGLIPIVPDIGGHTEFVPRKYHFHTLEEAAKIISSAINIPYSERVQISHSVNRFSISNYIRSFQQLVTESLLA